MVLKNIFLHPRLFGDESHETNPNSEWKAKTLKSIIKKFIFVDIPKTGGSSINKVLHKYASDLSIHIPISNYGNIPPNYFTFTFVRNPWDWIVSWYFYRKKEYNDETPFKPWLMCKNSSAYSGAGIGLSCDQSFFVIDLNGDISVNFIGRFENLQSDFDIVCKRICIPSVSLPVMNSTKHKPYQEYYDDESRYFVEHKFCRDIQLFGYTFCT